MRRARTQGRVSARGVKMLLPGSRSFIILRLPGQGSGDVPGPPSFTPQCWTRRIHLQTCFARNPADFLPRHPTTSFGRFINTHLSLSLSINSAITPALVSSANMDSTTVHSAENKVVNKEEVAPVTPWQWVCLARLLNSCLNAD